MFPGATEDICVPILVDKLVYRITVISFVAIALKNKPGDLDHKLPTILKVVSGSTKHSAL